MEDHALFRNGTAEALKSLGGVEIVGEADDGLGALEQARRLRPDVVLMDLVLPGITGLEATRRLTIEAPHIRVIVLTFRDDEDSLLEALEAGAAGYLLKSVSPEVLWAHVRGVMSGEVPISGSLVLRLLRGRLRPAAVPEQDRHVLLTAQDRQLVELVARGYTNREIGSTMYLSVSTVKLHLRQVLDKLRLSSRTELIAHVAREGLFGIDTPTMIGTRERDLM